VFTGIVEDRGTVAAPPAGARLAVTCPAVAADAEVGASVAVNGVCLTVVEANGGTLGFDLAPETLSRTTLGGLAPGDPVNLERPATPATLLGGHLVQGHVDGVGMIEAIEAEGEGARLRVRLPEALSRYVVEKGSIALDGVSLTVASVHGDAVEVALIPHTLAATTLGTGSPGGRVNVEVDVLAKYVERLMGRTG
jgi:riboflavin synthase